MGWDIELYLKTCVRIKWLTQEEANLIMGGMTPSLSSLIEKLAHENVKMVFKMEEHQSTIEALRKDLEWATSYILEYGGLFNYNKATEIRKRHNLDNLSEKQSVIDGKGDE